MRIEDIHTCKTKNVYIYEHTYINNESEGVLLKYSMRDSNPSGRSRASLMELCEDTLTQRT